MQKKVISNYGLVRFNPKIGLLSGATTPGQSGPGSDGNEGYSVFPKAPAIPKPHHQIV